MTPSENELANSAAKQILRERCFLSLGDYQETFLSAVETIESAITAAVAEERERCIDSLKSLLVDNSVSSGRAWNSAVKKCAKTIRDLGIRAIEEQPNA